MEDIDISATNDEPRPSFLLSFPPLKVLLVKVKELKKGNQYTS
jgi:hypothetical protein